MKRAQNFNIEEYIQEAKIYLDHLNPARSSDYDDWLKVGMSLKQVDGDFTC